MRVLMVTPGTRGDVAPMAGLGSRLQTLGFDVSIAANAAYASLVTTAGCEYRELPGDMSHLVSPAAPGKQATGADLRRYVNDLGDYMELAATGTMAAAKAGADVVLANAIAPTRTTWQRPSASPSSVRTCSRPNLAPHTRPWFWDSPAA